MNGHLLLAVAANVIFIISLAGAVDSSSSSAESGSSSFESSDSSDSHRYVRSDDGDTSSSYELESHNDSINGRDKQNRKCNKNERYVNCPEALCQPKSCADLGCDLNCPVLDSDSQCPGQPGCICIENYVRNREGRCIPRNECPSCGGDENAVAGCGINCGRLCSNYNQTDVACILLCKENGCDCKEGFVFDEQIKRCVRPEQCTTKICNKPNEVYDICPAPCPPRRCDVNEALILCAVAPKPGDPECEPGCRCADGYVRNSAGICIPKEECPTCSNPNEVYDECPAPCPPRRCDVDERTIRCAAPPKVGDPACQPGCRCADGFYRNSEGICVTNNECTPVCKENEVYSTCINGGCDAKNCSQLGQPKICVDPLTCIHGCLCKEGYLRAANGTCVPKEQCPITCGGDPNAQPGCGINCGRLCSNYNKGPVSCITLCKSNACDCKPGYVLDENTKRCVLPKQCTPTCGQYEVYSDCINGGCQAKNCSQLGKDVPCIKLAPESCIKGCLCQEGYLRNENGICVPENECPESCTGLNEVYDSCPPICPPQTCSSINKTYHCPLIKTDPKNCKGACRCKSGYYRNSINQCISKDDCLQCTGPNEYFSCGGACDNVCSTLSTQNQTNCPIVNIVCNRQCYCEEGYARDDNNTCIPIDQCKVSCGGDPNAEPGCGLNCNKRCSTLKTKGICPRIQCPPHGCECKSGFVYDDNVKKCVSPNECTPTCGDNEVYSACINGGCQAKNCTQIGIPLSCPRIPEENCIKGCLCAEGFLRANNGTCIPKNQCPVTCGDDPNAEPGCGLHCNKRCSTLKTKVICPRIKCPPNGCECKSGYVFDDNTKRCVTPKNCTSQCGAYEKFVECLSSITIQNCSQLGFPTTFSDNSKSCTGGSGCVCEDGYLRNNKGVCVPQKDCPSCGGDPNAQSGCGGYCGRRCSTLKNKGPTVCPAICRLNACDCKTGYVFDDNLGKCVLPEECTPTCRSNEVYSDCTNGGCQAKNCTQLGKPIRCAKIAQDKCKKGCLCKDGYLRAENGTCVLKEQCPVTCVGQNEVYDACPPTCPPQTCESIYSRYACPAIPVNRTCHGSCRCKPGFYRNKINQCISQDDCLKCTGPNEFFSCGGACDNVCSTLNEQNQTNCPIVNIVCNRMCYCQKGYARDENNICVPIDQCKVSCGGDPNAEPGCGQNCGRRCSNYNKGPVACALVCNENGCDCKQGYVYDDNINACVLPSKCSPVCRKNEVYSSCIQGNCKAQNCSQLGQSIPCPRIDPSKCIQGCLCQEGYLRGSNGTCIPENECPLKCTGPHEFFSCGSECDNECATINTQNRTNCPIVNIQCNRKCYCKDGYARDENNVCIPIHQCKVCGDNERLEKCPSNLCGPQNCSQLGYPLTCEASNDSETCPVAPACVCIDGYVRNKKGKCIPKEQCPSCGGDPNAVSGCGVNCNKHCSDLNGKPKACLRICYPNACDCKDGYYYDDSTKKCVKKEHCSKTCGENEVYTTCANGGCDMRNCSQVGQPMICIHPYKCTDGCVCVEGYLRDDNGVCVPENQCQGPTSTSPTPIEGPSTEITTTESTDIPISDEETARAAILFTKGDVNFSNRFLYQLLQTNPDKSFISSGFSILFVLGQLGLFSQNLAQLQINNATGLSTLNEYVAAYKGVIKNIREQRSVTLELANKIYANELVPLSNNFIDTTRNVFDAEAQNTDFSQSREAAATINDWVANKTHGKIEDLVDESMFDASTRLVLVNALYFQSNWSTQFNPSNTKDRDFYVNGNVIKKLPTMYMKSNSMPYGENEELDCQILQMPYQSKNFSCGFILPRNQTTVLSVAEKLYKNPDLWSSALGSLRREAVNIYIPKMELRTDIDLSSIFEQLGLGALLDPSQNSFTGILKKDEPLYVSKAVQQAYVKIEESGTEAAAATAVIVSRAAAVRLDPVTYTFEANRPFLFYIIFQGNPIFSAVYNGQQ